MSSSDYYNLHCPSCDEIIKENIPKDQLNDNIELNDIERTLLPKVCHHCYTCINSTTTQPDKGDKSLKRAREDFLRNDDVFMALAFLYAGRDSRNDTNLQSLQIGACLVNEDKCLKYLLAFESLQDLHNKLEELPPQSGSLYLTVRPNQDTIDLLERSPINAVYFIPHERILMNSNNHSAKTKCQQFIPKRISRIVIQSHEANKLNKAPDYQVPFHNNMIDDYIRTNDRFFITLAYLVGMKSEDPSKQVGSCIVNGQNCQPPEIISIGYSHMESKGVSYDRDKDKKLKSIIFGEIDAIKNAGTRTDLNNCTIYTTIYPGERSAKAIKEARYISQVVYTPSGKLLREGFISSRRESEEVISKTLHCRPFFHEGSTLVTINFFVNRKPHVLRLRDEVPETSRPKNCLQ